MKSSKPKDNLVLQDVIVHYMLSFKHVCLVTVMCPFAALLICFITANIYQPDEVHETHCRVSHILMYAIKCETKIDAHKFSGILLLHCQFSTSLVA